LTADEISIRVLRYYLSSFAHDCYLLRTHLIRLIILYDEDIWGGAAYLSIFEPSSCCLFTAFHLVSQASVRSRWEEADSILKTREAKTKVHGRFVKANCGILASASSLMPYIHCIWEFEVLWAISCTYGGLVGAQ
jgi:hypothetical protein